MATKKNEAYIEFKANTEEFQKGIKEMNSSLKTASNELRLNSTQLKGAGDSVELLTDRQEILQRELKASAQKVELTEKSLAECEATLGKNSKEYDNLRNAVLQAKNQQQAIQNELDETAERLKNVGKSAEEAGDGFTIAKGAISGFIANGLSAGVGMIKEGISNLMGLAEETREYRNEMAKLDTSFQTANLSAENAEKTFEDLYGILGDEGAAVEASQQLAKISKNEKDLETNTRILTGVMAEYGNSIPLEGLAEGIAASSAMGSVQGVLADALEWQGINLDSFNEKLEAMSTEEERSAYIQKTLTGLYGESADAYLKNNEAVIEANKAQADYNDTMAKLGEKVEPITTKVKEGIAKVAEKALELVEGVDIEGFGNKIDTAFEKLTDEIIPAIVDGFQWVLDNKDAIISGLAGIGAGLAVFKVASIIQGVVGAIKAFKAANEGATIAQALLNAVMNANPMILVASLIAGVVVAIVTFIATNEDARKKIAEVWEKIKSAFSGAIEKVKQKFNEFKTKINEVKQKFVDLKTGAENTINKLKNSISTKFNEIKNKIMTPINEAKNKVKAAVEKIKSFFNFKIKLPKIKTPKVTVTWKTTGALAEAAQWVGFKGIPKFSIKWNAKGGVFNKPTVLQGFGEAGTEYALPLNEQSLAPLASLLTKMSMTGKDGLVDVLASRFDNAVDKLASRLEKLESNFYIDGERVATATAGYNDKASGVRLQLIERGMALK